MVASILQEYLSGARLTVGYRLARKGQTASVNHLALEGIVASLNM